ncbi:MAG: hypothetical protein ABIG08_01405 [bacterium]
MTKNLFKISLIFGIFGLFFLIPSLSLALDAPTGTNVICGPGGINSCKLQPTLDWDDVAGAVNYRIQTYGPVSTSTEVNCSIVTEGTWNELSQMPALSKIQLQGLTPLRYYCWRVRAESVTVSDWVIGPRFLTLNLTRDDGDNGSKPPGGELPGNGDGGTPEYWNPLQAETLEEALQYLINLLFYLAMVLGPLFVIYAAFLMLTAAGDPVKINKAKTVLFWTLAALAIILFARGLPEVIKGAFGG